MIAILLVCLSGTIILLVAIIKAWWTTDCLSLIPIFVVFVLGTFVFLTSELSFLTGNIILDEKGIKNKGQIAFASEKVQYPAFVSYRDIERICIAPYHLSSKGTPVREFRPLPFLLIKTKNGKTVRFDLTYLSNQTMRKILFELKTRCHCENNAIDLDIDALIKDFKEAKWSIKPNHKSE